MTSEEYRTEREKRGTQQGVALRLGIHWRTIQDRENARIPITEEARRAILSVPLRKKKRAPRRPNAASDLSPANGEGSNSTKVRQAGD